MMIMAATILTFSASVLSVSFGIIYLIRPKFMGYHKKALRKEWIDLAPENQTLIMALMRAAGGGFLAVGTAMAMLQLEFNSSQKPMLAWIIVISGTILAIGALYAMLLVRMKTLGRPPLLPVILIFIMMLAGFLLNMMVAAS
jgi:hypothetical protein